MERQIHKEGLQEEERTKLNGLNKVHYGRFTEGLERGFDILTNTKFNQKNDPASKTIYDPHVVKPDKLWGKVMKQSNGKTVEEDTTQAPGGLNTQSASSHAKTDSNFWKTHSDIIERRSRRLQKGSALGSVHTPSEAAIQTPVQPVKVQPEISKPLKPPAKESVFQTGGNEVLKSQRSNIPSSHRSNSQMAQAAPSRHSNVASSRASKPVSKRANSQLSNKSGQSKGILSSGRGIRSGAFQRIAAS